MRVAKYNWNNKDFFKSAVQMCYSENVGVLIPHSHQTLELMYFYNTSTCRYVCGNNTITLKSNDLVVVNSYEMHSCNDWGNNCKAICVLIDLKRLNVPALQSLYFNNKISSNDEIKAIFENIKEVLFWNETNEPQKECKINGLIYMLLGEISKYAYQLTNQPPKTVPLNEVFDFIQKNLSQNISVSHLAKIIHLSVDRFYHIFKENTGISPSEYIMAKRIEMACEYIKNTDMRISEIAQECNFCTSSYFCEKFKSFMKMTPNEYRKENLTRFFVSEEK